MLTTLLSVDKILTSIELAVAVVITMLMIHKLMFSYIRLFVVVY